MIIKFSKKERSKTLKKLLLVSLICLLVFSFAITAMAKVELVFWGYPIVVDPDKENGWYERRVIAEFQEIYPEVGFELQILPWADGRKKVQMAIATGTTPNIIHDTSITIMSYASAGVMADFEDTLDVEEQADYYTSILEQVKIDGKVYMIILNAGGGGMEINRFIAEEAGAMDLVPLAREDRGWTVEEFKKFALKIAEADIPDVYAFAFHFTDANVMQQYILFTNQSFGAVPFVIEDGKYRCTLNSPEAVEGLEWYLDLYHTPGVGMPGAESMGIDYYTDYWYTGKLACTFAAANAINSLTYARKDPKILSKLDQINVCAPHKEGLESLSLVAIQGLGVFKSTPEKEKYAKLFCEFYATRPYLWEVTKTMCPPRESSHDPNSPRYQTSPYPPDDPEVDFALSWADYMAAVDGGSNCPVYQQYREIYAATMQGVFSGELTAKEGLDIVVGRINKLLDDYYEENP